MKSKDQQMNAPPEDPVREFTERVAPQFVQAQEQLEELNERVKSFVKSNPGAVLLGAAALGFLVGRWASRP